MLTSVKQVAATQQTSTTRRLTSVVNTGAHGNASRTPVLRHMRFGHL
ncbi:MULTISPECIES: hypothetical protein [unclassified Mycobacterium]|nr:MULTISPECIES: hypothetical protein [unclassified Mycobacterium]